MKTWVRRSLNAGALTAGALLATGTAAAHAADPTLVTNDNTGILNGTQALLPIQAPINICGNAIGIAGNAYASCHGGSAATLNPEWGFAHFVSSHNTGILNGTQIGALVQAPINICGNAIGIAGNAYASCHGGSSATIGHHHHGHGCGCGESATTTESATLPTLPVIGGLGGLLGTVGAVHSLPVVGDLLGGNALGGLLGTGSGVLASTPAASVLPGVDSLGSGPVGSGPVGSALGGLDSLGLGSLGGSGTEHTTEDAIENPPPVSGGTGGGTGHPTPPPSHCPPPPPVCHDHGGPRLISSHNTGILNGTQVYAPIQAPIDISGNAMSVLGTASAWSVGGAHATM